MKEPSLNQAQSVAGSLQWVSKMRPWLRPFIAGLYSFFENKSAYGKNWQRIIDYELKICEIFLKCPRFITTETFLGTRLKVEIYTDACAKSPFESDSINWTSGIGIGWILAAYGEVVEFHPLEVSAEIFSWLEGLKSALMLISFFELLAAYVGIRLWGPNRIGNKDLSWPATPIVTDNIGNDFILKNVRARKTNVLDVTGIGAP